MSSERSRFDFLGLREQDCRMEAQGRTRPTSRVGYAITLVGCAIFVASLVMDLYCKPGHGVWAAYWYSFWGLSWKVFAIDPVSRAGLLLFFFGGVGIVAILSVVGLVRSVLGRSLAWALASATASWFLTTVAFFFLQTFGRFPPGGARWPLLGLAVAAAGSIVVVLSSRGRKTAADPESHTDAQGRTSPVGRVGYAVTLLGCAVFVASRLMHVQDRLANGAYYSYSEFSMWWRNATIPTEHAAVLLFLFGGVALVAILSAVSLARSEVGRSFAWALAAGVAAWFLMSMGWLFPFGRFRLEGERWALLGLLAAAAGSVIVVFASRSRRTIPADPGSRPDLPE